ncbi:MAG: 2-phospho-L-lactate guanylyltransferase [Candidatus Nanopelagicales bacterium]
MQWSAIVPVKAFATAKSRLDEDPDRRAALSFAFMSDVLAALEASTLISQIIVVSDDSGLSLPATTRVRVHATRALGLNADIQEGLEQVGDAPVVVVAADLPCLTATAMDAVLKLAQALPRAFVTDTQGLGTTMLLDQDARQSTPRFGSRSHAQHIRADYHEIRSDDPATQALLARARRDVDTAIDLWDAERMGVGQATRAVNPIR